MNTQPLDPSLPMNDPLPVTAAAPATAPRPTRCTDWYAEGESRVVVVGDVRVVVTFLCQKGRRARVQIEAPAGAEFEEESRGGPSG